MTSSSPAPHKLATFTPNFRDVAERRIDQEVAPSGESAPGQPAGSVPTFHRLLVRGEQATTLTGPGRALRQLQQDRGDAL